jgi:hypothetical protein
MSHQGHANSEADGNANRHPDDRADRHSIPDAYANSDAVIYTGVD